MKQNSIELCEHLYQMYPNIPKYANDPQQSQIIRTYDLILKRFQGLYGRQPKYFVRSPAICPILGSPSNITNMQIAFFSSLQNVVICLAFNEHNQIRINHYQSALYGQKKLSNQSVKWRYQQTNDDYTNLITASFKVYSVMFNMHTLPGMDILIFDDFVHDDYLFAKQALCLAIFCALQSMLLHKKNLSNINNQFCYKFLQKVNNLVNFIKPNQLAIGGTYNCLSVLHPSKQGQKFNQNKLIKFPENIDIILAHSMTPLPKKMIKGKRQNLRFCEIQVGIQIIKNQIGSTTSINSLSQLKAYLNCTNEQLLETLDEYIPKGDLSPQKIEQITQKSLIDILKSVPFANNVIDQNLLYKPYNRIKFSILQQLAIEKLTTENLLNTIKQSYSRGKQLLEIGSQQIDDMVSIIQNLAKSWKILGDGWGGYLVILSQSNKTNLIVEELTKEFYMNPKNQVLLSDDVDQYIKIIGKPSNGLAIFDPSSEIWFC